MFAFAKACLAVLAVVSLACATITIDTPTIIGNSTNTIKWRSSDIEGDPGVFSIELINKAFNSQFALANNVQTTQGSITFSLPVVAAGDGYSIQFVNIGNINDIIAETPDFAVIQHDADTPLPTVTSVPRPPASPVTTTRRSTTSASTFPATLTQTSPSAISSPSTLSTPASPASSTAASPSPSNAAMGLVPTAPLAALVAGAIALAF